MKNKIYQIVALFGLFFMLASYQLLKTQLRVTVLDDLGNLHSGAKVSLYENIEQYNSRKPVFGPLDTDKKGKAIFFSVGVGPYLIEVLDGDYSNDFGGQQTEKLSDGKINKVNVIISK